MSLYGLFILSSSTRLAVITFMRWLDSFRHLFVCFVRSSLLSICWPWIPAHGIIEYVCNEVIFNIHTIVSQSFHARVCCKIFDFFVIIISWSSFSFRDTTASDARRCHPSRSGDCRCLDTSSRALLQWRGWGGGLGLAWHPVESHPPSLFQSQNPPIDPHESTKARLGRRGPDCPASSLSGCKGLAWHRFSCHTADFPVLIVRNKPLHKCLRFDCTDSAGSSSEGGSDPRADTRDAVIGTWKVSV